MKHTQLIIGHVTHSSARIWVRGIEEKEQTKAKIELHHFSLVAPLIKQLDLIEDNNFIAVADFAELEAAISYTCIVTFNDVPSTTITGTCQTFPINEGKKFSFLISSCNLKSPDKIPLEHFPVLGSKFKHREVFKKLKNICDAHNAKFMIHAGDQIYIDITEPKASIQDVDDYREKYKDVWDTEEAAEFFSSIPNYMILDDHELANEFSNDREYKFGNSQFYKERGLIAYREFQHSHNPDVFPGKYYYKFNYGDVHFFVLDVRTERTNQRMIKESQLDKLISWLNEYKDKIKIIITPVPFITRLDNLAGIVGDKYGFADKWDAPNFIGQKNRILHEIFSKENGKTLFLTGDVHAALHTNVKCGNTKIHELVAGPMNQIIFNGEYMFKPKYTKTFKIKFDEIEYSYECAYSKEKQVGEDVNLFTTSRKVATLDKYANALLVTVEGNLIKYKWIAVHEEVPGEGERVLMDGTIELRF